MKDWRSIARASGLELPTHELDRVAAPLDHLEQAFRPLGAGLAPEMEPSFAFRLEETE